jgi:hypothetical protein
MRTTRDQAYRAGASPRCSLGRQHSRTTKALVATYNKDMTKTTLVR